MGNGHMGNGHMGNGHMGNGHMGNGHIGYRHMRTHATRGILVSRFRRCTRWRSADARGGRGAAGAPARGAALAHTQRSLSAWDAQM